MIKSEITPDQTGKGQMLVSTEVLTDLDLHRYFHSQFATVNDNQYYKTLSEKAQEELKEFISIVKDSNNGDDYATANAVGTLTNQLRNLSSNEVQASLSNPNIENLSIAPKVFSFYVPVEMQSSQAESATDEVKTKKAKIVAEPVSPTETKEA